MMCPYTPRARLAGPRPTTAWHQTNDDYPHPAPVAKASDNDWFAVTRYRSQHCAQDTQNTNVWLAYLSIGFRVGINDAESKIGRSVSGQAAS